jgi:hypothetical protein
MTMAKLELTNGGYTTVDDDDYNYLSKWKWQSNKTNGHVERSEYISNLKLSKGKHRSINRKIAIHRVINNTPQGYDTDHINGDKLDNRKTNLRTVNRSHNNLNRKNVRGVQFRKDRKRSPFRVYVSCDKKSVYVACFKSYQEARQAYYTVNEQLNEGILQW